MELKVEYVPIDTIKPYERNAKLHPAEQVDEIAKSIELVGFRDPIGIWNGVIVEGHGRLLAAKKLGMDTVPIIRMDDMTDEERRAYILIHNKTTMDSGFDPDLLKFELDNINDIDMTMFNFFEDEPTPEEQLNEVREDDFLPEPPEEPKSKLGDIYELGIHRLICGDSTNPETIKTLMGENEADLLLTDPPYNVDYVGKTKDALKIQNDKMGEDAFTRFLTDAFEAASPSLKPGGVFYIWHADTERRSFIEACANTGWQIRQILVWNKNVFVMGRQDYQWKHEPCIYGWKDGGAHFFIDDRRQTSVMEDRKPNIKAMKKAELMELLEKIFADKESTTVINEDRPARSELHPTMKPIKLLARLICNSSRIGEKVLDPFGGSGSTLITCDQLKRQCFMAELDPKYCDVIIERYERFTGRKAVLMNG
ncbi:MAG: site-specific DNA-methyltransferase [Methanomicrobium sp.]|nr:site-specific DNA-methyltransferase [Methanomicrobium sp.]